MLNINFEFRKGIFFIRLFGNLADNTYKNKVLYLRKIIKDNRLKYVVLNTNYLKNISLDGLNYLTKNLLTIKNTNIIICDKTKIIKTLLNGSVVTIEDELEVL